LARGLTIVDLIASAENSVGITELAEKLQIDKSTASRLVQTLVNYGWVERDPKSRRYRIGGKFSVLNQSSPTNHEWLRVLTRPILSQLVSQTGECAHLAVSLLGEAYVIEDVETTALLRVAAGVGRTTPLHCTAVGKVLLTFTDLPLPTKLTPYTARTITDTEKLQLQLKQIHCEGFALDDEELTEGVRCIAAPVFDFSGKCVASVGVSGPAVRVTIEKIPGLAEIVVRAGLELSYALKYNPERQ
jgi:IclR family transcriptional regulator, KDG regulon repressor